MSGLTSFLAEHGGPWLLTTSALMLIGIVVVRLSRRIVDRQRIAELTVAACLAWLVLAVIPLPRLIDFASAPATTEERVREEVAAVRRPGDDIRATSEVGEELVPVPPWMMRSLGLAAHEGSGTVSTEEGAVPPISPAASLPPEEETSRFDIPSLLVGVFLVGAAVGLAWVLVGGLALGSVLLRSRPAPVWLRRLVRALPADGRPGRVRLRVTRVGCHPFCVGGTRGLIVIPEALCDPARADMLRHVLLHEVGHLRRADGRGQLLMALALPVFWFHPAYWWLRRTVRLAAEMVADDWAAAQTRKSEYARRLIGFAEEAAGLRHAPSAARTVFRGRSEFYRRIEMLMQRQDRIAVETSGRRRACQTVIALVVVGMAAALFGVAPAAAQDVVQDPETGRRTLAVPEAAPVEDPLAGEPQDELARLRKENGELKDMLRRIITQLEALKKGRNDRRAGPGDPAGPAGPRGLRRAGPGGSGPSRGSGKGSRGLTLEEVEPPEEIEEIEEEEEVEEAEEVEEIEEVEAEEPEEEPVADSAMRRHGATPAASSQPVVSAAVLAMLTQAIDMQGAVELAEVEMVRTERLVTSKSASEAELVKAKIQLETARRKHRLVRHLIKAEIEATEADLEAAERSLQHLSKTARRSAVRSARFRRLLARIELLKSAL